MIAVDFNFKPWEWDTTVILLKGCILDWRTLCKVGYRDRESGNMEKICNNYSICSGEYLTAKEKNFDARKRGLAEREVWLEMEEVVEKKRVPYINCKNN